MDVLLVAGCWFVALHRLKHVRRNEHSNSATSNVSHRTLIASTSFETMIWPLPTVYTPVTA